MVVTEQPLLTDACYLRTASFVKVVSIRAKGHGGETRILGELSIVGEGTITGGKVSSDAFECMSVVGKFATVREFYWL